MVISAKFAFSIEKSQTCELKKPFFLHKSVLFFLCGSLSAEIVVSILPFLSTLVTDNFKDCCTAFEIPESIAETGATHTHKKFFFQPDKGVGSKHNYQAPDYFLDQKSLSPFFLKPSVYCS